MLRRAGYAIAVTLTFFLIPFFFLGAFLFEEEEIGWFKSSVIGLAYVSFLLLFPLLLLLSAGKWIVTGKGFI